MAVQAGGRRLMAVRVDVAVGVRRLADRGVAHLPLDPPETAPSARSHVA